MSNNYEPSENVLELLRSSEELVGKIGETSVCVRELGIKGAFVQSEMAVEDNQRVTLNIELGEGGRQLAAQALVRWRRPGKGFGVEFVAVADHEALADYMRSCARNLRAASTGGHKRGETPTDTDD
ncbi:MAG: PilZ domain-containing protein [Deltaproteobacteria bacterium]|nr:PilZ domain-containing protein [Deltaproteobacteria bacterium]